MVRTIVLFEWATLVLGGLLIVTQIIHPAIRGRPLLPLLRRTAVRLESDIAEAREDVELQSREQELQRLRRPRKRQQEG